MIHSENLTWRLPAVKWEWSLGQIVQRLSKKRARAVPFGKVIWIVTAKNLACHNAPRVFLGNILNKVTVVTMKMSTFIAERQANMYKILQIYDWWAGTVHTIIRKKEVVMVETHAGIMAKTTEETVTTTIMAAMAENNNPQVTTALTIAKIRWMSKEDLKSRTANAGELYATGISTSLTAKLRAEN
jgi:hypothetical protein